MMLKGNMWKLNGEIDVLVNFKSKEQSTKLIYRGEAESKIFDLIDAIGGGQQGFGN